MQVTSVINLDATDPHSVGTGVEDAPGPTAARLSDEFGAPVGLLANARGVWCAAAGADIGRFPRADERMAAALRAPAQGRSRAGLWRPDRDGGVVWLVLPVPRSGGDDHLVAVA